MEGDPGPRWKRVSHGFPQQWLRPALSELLFVCSRQETLSCHADFIHPPADLGLGGPPRSEPPACGSCLALMNRRSQPRARSCPYLIVADGHRGVEEVPDLPQALEAFCLQPQALGVALQDGFVDEQTDFLDLGHLQSLHRDPGQAGKGRNRRGEGAGSQGRLIMDPHPTDTKLWAEHPKQQLPRTKDREKSGLKGLERAAASHGAQQCRGGASSSHGSQSQPAPHSLNVAVNKVGSGTGREEVTRRGHSVTAAAQTPWAGELPRSKAEVGFR